MVVAMEVLDCADELVVTSSTRTIVVGDTMTPSAEIDKFESASGTNSPCSCTVPATDSNASNVKTLHKVAALNGNLRSTRATLFRLAKNTAAMDTAASSAPKESAG